MLGALPPFVPRQEGPVGKNKERVGERKEKGGGRDRIK